MVQLGHVGRVVRLGMVLGAAAVLCSCGALQTVWRVGLTEEYVAHYSTTETDTLRMLAEERAGSPDAPFIYYALALRLMEPSAGGAVDPADRDEARYWLARAAAAPMRETETVYVAAPDLSFRAARQARDRTGLPEAQRLLQQSFPNEVLTVSTDMDS